MTAPTWPGKGWLIATLFAAPAFNVAVSFALATTIREFTYDTGLWVPAEALLVIASGFALTRLERLRAMTTGTRAAWAIAGALLIAIATAAWAFAAFFLLIYISCRHGRCFD